MEKEREKAEGGRGTFEKDFAVFILSNRRARKVTTLSTIRKGGYEGAVYIVCDDEDPQLDEYRERYGDMVQVFDKEGVAERTDLMALQEQRGGAVFARNACYDIARKLGVRWFLVLDDDYSGFAYRFTSERVSTELKVRKTLGRAFEAFWDWYSSMPSYVVTICTAQGGDIMGGKISTSLNAIKTKRKAMNSFFCCVDRPMKFAGIMNEDTNYYTARGRAGDVCLTVYFLSLRQERTQRAEGGMSELYKYAGTWIKSFLTVMCCPSAVHVKVLESDHARIHHIIKYEYCAPKIVDGRWKKKA